MIFNHISTSLTLFRIYVRFSCSAAKNGFWLPSFFYFLAAAVRFLFLPSCFSQFFVDAGLVFLDESDIRLIAKDLGHE